MEGTMLCVLLLSLIIGDVSAITKDDFPPGFIFGAGTSAYQVEGAVSEDGRKPSIWDTYTHAGRIVDKSTADETADQYHKYKEDVKRMHEMGLEAYRFSISWSRLIPDGRGIVNPKGLQYYNNLIDELVSYGIHPHVTLYHFDLPQALEDEYDGQLSPKIIEDFSAFAEVCFKEFGDRVKYWTTFNEPNMEAVGGHDVGLYPPGRCSYPFGFQYCSKGNSTIEPYIAAHNILLSHASAASLYKDKYQEEQGGYIGMTILAFWFKPFSDSNEDAAATQRVIDFHIGWFLDPLVHGAYPAVMRKIVGSRLPSFTIEESEKLRASFDFIGINHYALFDVKDRPEYQHNGDRDYVRDVAITLPTFQNMLVKKFEPEPLAPWSLQKLLEYLKLNYGNPPIMIYENGYAEFNIDPKSPSSGYNDDDRVNYLQEYVDTLLQSIRNGSNTMGYFVWSFLDCFELAFGYTARYGLYGVDFKGKEKRRYPRLSAHWYSSFLQSDIFTNRGTMLDVI